MASQYYYLEDFIRALENWGLTDILLPFLLIFTIVFAILQKTNMFGVDKKNIHAVIALVISLTTVIPHVTNSYSSSADPVDIINSSLPSVSVIVIAIMMMLLLIGILGGEAKWIGGSLSSWIAIIALVVIIGIFGGAAGWWGEGWVHVENFFGSDAIAIIVIILVFAIIVGFIVGGDKPDEGLLRKTWSDVGDMFKGGGHH
ncbi:hypothetical protein ACFL0W_02945 [Nanoarchaeota archaeon]